MVGLMSLFDFPLYLKTNTESTAKAYKSKYVYCVELFFGDITEFETKQPHPGRYYPSYHKHTKVSDEICTYVRGTLGIKDFQARRNYSNFSIALHFQKEEHFNTVLNSDLKCRLLTKKSPVSSSQLDSLLYDRVLFRKTLIFNKYRFKAVMSFSQPTSYHYRNTGGTSKASEVNKWISEYSKDMSLTKDHIKIATTTWGPMAIYFADEDHAATFRLTFGHEIKEIIRYKTFDECKDNA